MANGHDEVGLVGPVMTAPREPTRMNPTMPDPLVQLILDSIYREAPYLSQQPELSAA